MKQLFVESFWLFWPILAANQAAALAQLLKLPLATTPVSRRLLGENKTWAPYYVAPILAWMVLYIYNLPYLVGYALVLGWGAVLGDHGKSFFKRCLGYPPGARWLPDRFDFALGAGLLLMWYTPYVRWQHVVVLVAMAIPTHFVGNAIGYQLGWRKTPH